MVYTFDIIYDIDYDSSYDTIGQSINDIIGQTYDLAVCRIVVLST